MKKIAKIVLNLILLYLLLFSRHTILHIWAISLIVIINLPRKWDFVFILIGLIITSARGDFYISGYALVLFLLAVLFRRLRKKILHKMNADFRVALKRFRTALFEKQELQNKRDKVFEKLNDYRELYNIARNIEKAESFEELNEEFKFWLRSQNYISYIRVTFFEYFRKIFEFNYEPIMTFTEDFREFEFEEEGIKIYLKGRTKEEFFNMLFNILKIEIKRIYLTEEIKRHSITDSLTGLYVQRHLRELLGREIKRCMRYKEIFSIVMLDIDDFKKINDTLGHITGDKVLKDLAQFFIENKKVGVERVGRYGGEEFLIIIMDTNKEAALKRIEELLDLVRHREFGGVRITLSAGIAEFPQDAISVEDLINAADKALYVAKSQGKDRVTLYG